MLEWNPHRRREIEIRFKFRAQSIDGLPGLLDETGHGINVIRFAPAQPDILDARNEPDDFLPQMRRIINGEIVFNLDVIRRAGNVTKLNELNRTAARGEQEADDAEYEQSALQCAPHIVSPPAQVRKSVASWR